MAQNKGNIVIITEVRIYNVKGRFFADSSFAEVLGRYCDNFGKVYLVTRIIRESRLRNGYVNIDSDCSDFYNIQSIPRFLFSKTDKSLKDLLNGAVFVVLRVPSLVSIKAYKYIIKYKKKYMVEVMGCAWDAYWNHGFIGKLIAPYVYSRMKRIIYDAKYAIYVTQQFLQNRYPCKGKTIGVSNVSIASIDKPKVYKNFDRKSFTMMTAGAVNVKHKGQEYVIRAMKKLKDVDGINIKYYLAGKGDSSRLRKIAKENGLSENVVVLGMLSKGELAKQMRDTDIYIQPSLQEGLPRSLIEAMSHGCVCLGARTAGIPELLKEKQLFERKSVNAIVDSIRMNIDGDLSKISMDNVLVTKKYTKELLDKKRNSFYNSIILDLYG